MQTRVTERLDPGAVVPGARTVIALGIAYGARDDDARQPELPVIARYARGRDYHLAHRDRMRALRRSLLELDPTVNTYACVDAGVAMEKAWAERAGLGWIGKNGVLVSREHGSWFTLSVMVINRGLDRYHQPHPRLCGDCDLCLRACPTGAFPSPGVVDARLCLSYQTVENHDIDPGRAACGPGRAGFRLRCLPGGLPLQPRPAAAWRSPPGAATTRAHVGDTRSRPSVATSLSAWLPAPRWRAQATMVCAAMPPWRWALTSGPAPAPRSSSLPATRVRWSARPRVGRSASDLRPRIEVEERPERP
jgi:ferredoxin